MRLPRWTVYPALGVLAVVAVTAVPHPSRDDPNAGAARAARGEAAPASAAEAGPTWERVVVLGIDGLDPDILAETIELYPERMANFRRLADEGSGIHPLGTSCPPQSPVAWSNFITGQDPGGHGVFDFIHRDPKTRVPASSATFNEPSFLSFLFPEHGIGLPGKWVLPPPEDMLPVRTADPFWTILERNGVPADVWRMPANFPVEGSKGLAFSGMMTPALDSAYGECSFFTTDPMLAAALDYQKVELVREDGGKIQTWIHGPANTFQEGMPPANANVTIYVDRESGAAAIDVGDEKVVLRPGEWSEFVPLTFDMLPLDMGLMDMKGMCRFYLRSIEPDVELYVSAVNVDPEDPAFPVSAPDDASEELSQAIGRYYTQGMAEDVNSLKNGVLSDAEFMDQVDLVYDERCEMLDHALDHYMEDEEGGLLFFYYSTIDLSCHMMWRHSDASHPAHDPAFAGSDSSDWSRREGSKWKEVVQDLYMRMDPVLGRIRERVGDDVTLIVMSDHGFAPYRREFNLNTWLYENGYLVLKAGKAPESQVNPPSGDRVYIFDAVDWSKTRAYGMGFNGLYLNREGRELDDPATPEDESGIVRPGAEAQALLREIKAKLEAEVDEVTGLRPVVRCDLASDVYHGARLDEAPDMLVGYNAGYGNSDAASTGRVTHAVLQDNTPENNGGQFNGSHLMVPDVVAGTVMSNRAVRPGKHDLTDLTVEILGLYGVEPPPEMRGHRVLDGRTP